MTTEPESPETGREEPQVFAVSKNANEVRFTRREFLELAGVAGAALTLAGCSQADKEAAIATGLTQTAAALTPTATIKSANTTLRAVPGTQYAVLLDLHSGDTVAVISRTSEGDWLRVKTSSGQGGWLAASAADLNVPLDRVPVETNPQPVATPTLEPKPGEVEAGDTGINIEIGGKSYTLPCGAPIPAGAICTCNCVTVPAPAPSCSCAGYSSCSCVGASHYWYPN